MNNPSGEFKSCIVHQSLEAKASRDFFVPGDRPGFFVFVAHMFTKA